MEQRWRLVARHFKGEVLRRWRRNHQWYDEIGVHSAFVTNLFKQACMHIKKVPNQNWTVLWQSCRKGTGAFAPHCAESVSEKYCTWFPTVPNVLFNRRVAFNKKTVIVCCCFWIWNLLSRVMPFRDVIYLRPLYMYLLCRPIKIRLRTYRFKNISEGDTANIVT